MVVEQGFLSSDQAALVLDFHQFEGRKRDPIEVAVSLSVLSVDQGRALEKAIDDLKAGGGKKADKGDKADKADKGRTQGAPKAQLAQQAQQPMAATGGISQLIIKAIEAGASDLHLHSRHPPFMRISGTLVEGFAPAIPEEHFKAELKVLLSPEQQRVLQRDGAVNLCPNFQRGYRLRINVFKAQHGLSAAMRIIPPEIPTLAQLNLPRGIERLLEFHQGLVLLSGPANCGKSTTLAALIHRLNLTRKLHIVTIEDPIEFIHSPQQGAVTQRQVSMHTDSYASALKAALREDPDVIVIGEMRDMETMRVALTAAETGHLVIGTLHTRSVETTVARVLDAFGDEEAQMRGTLADALKGIFVQLVRSPRGLVPVVEMMLNNGAFAHCIRQRKLHQIQSLIQTGRGADMITWEDSVNELKGKKLLSAQMAATLLSDEGRTLQ